MRSLITYNSSAESVVLSCFSPGLVQPRSLGQIYLYNQCVGVCCSFVSLGVIQTGLEKTIHSYNNYNISNSVWENGHVWWGHCFGREWHRLGSSIERRKRYMSTTWIWTFWDVLLLSFGPTPLALAQVETNNFSRDKVEAVRPTVLPWRSLREISTSLGWSPWAVLRLLIRFWYGEARAVGQYLLLLTAFTIWSQISPRTGDTTSRKTSS